MKENEYISREEVISQLEYCLANFTDYKKALEETLDKVKHTKTISLPKEHGRLIEEIVVTYPWKDLCTCPEFKEKPYFSIKYEENGKHYIGFGTYNPEVLSLYLKKYFI